MILKRLSHRSIQSQLIFYFAFAILIPAGITALVGMKLIYDQVITRAETKTISDLNSAREIYRNKISHIESIVRLTAVRSLVVNALVENNQAFLRKDLARALSREKLDMLTEFIKLCRHRIERRSCFRESGSTAGGENGQFALRRALRAAGDRRVEVVPARRLQLFGEPPRDIRVHRRRRNKYGVLGECFGDALLAEQNGFGLGGVDDHADNDAGLP